MVEIRRRASSIDRSEALAGEVLDLIRANAINQSQLARDCNIGSGTIYRLVHPEDPQGVSAGKFAKIVTRLTDSPVDRMRLFSLAGVPIRRDFDDIVNSIGAGDRINRLLRSSGLNGEFSALAEDIIVSNARATVRNLREAQARQEALESLIPKRRSRVAQKAVS